MPEEEETIFADNEKSLLIEIRNPVILEFIEFYIHYKKDAKKAHSLLKDLENHITLKEISNMRRAIRWNLLMSDLYKNFSESRDKAQFYLKQSQKLKTQLHTIGVSE